MRDRAASADVVLENFKTGTLAKFGLDYASLAAANQRLVYCSITGFGQTGPRAHEAGYDPRIGALYFARIPDPGDRFLGTHPPNADRQRVVAEVAAGF